MSRARKIPRDLHTVAQLAGTTATVVEGAAIAADKAQAAVDAATDVKNQVSRASRGRGKGLMILLILAGLAAVGVVIWKRSGVGGAEEGDVTDLRAGSMP